jgi:sugar diacid utilization regulator
VVRSDLWGYLVLIEQMHAFEPLDSVIASRAAMIVALELTAARREAVARGEALESLVIELLRGVYDETRFEQRATFLGLRLTNDHVVALIDCSGVGAAQSHSARDVLEAFRAVDPSLQVLTTALAEGVVAIIEVPAEAPTPSAVAEAKRVVSSVCLRLAATGRVAAGLSTICQDVGEIPRLYEEARQVVSMINKFAPLEQAPILAVDELGVARLLLLTADRSEVDRYVRDILRGLLETANPRTAGLLMTARCFLDNSCSIRATAQELDVHENTVRYRLARIKDIAGLDIVGNVQDQMALQFALLVLRIEGALVAPQTTTGSDADRAE